MTTYSGSLALRLAGAEELIARSTAFQKRVGAGSIAQAKDKIYGGELTLIDVLEAVEGGTLAPARPCALIGPESHSYSQIAQPAGNVLGANGAVWVLFIDNASDPDNHKLSLLDFADWTSGTLDDIASLVGKDYGATGDGATTLWPFNAVRMLFPPLRQDVADRKADDYWISGYVLFDSIGSGN